MRQFVKIALAFAASLVIGTAASRAADLHNPAYKSPAYVPTYFTWSGFYAGLNAGYGFGKAKVTAPATGATTGDFSANGAVVGGTFGYNLQTGSWVWGIEGDIDYSAMKGSTSAGCVGACTVSNTWLGTARARLGYAGWDRWLPYITGGAAFGNVKFEQLGVADSKTKFGWTAGAGIEYAFLANWSAKAEYLYTDLGTASCSAGTCTAAQIDYAFKASLVRFGVNYRF